MNELQINQSSEIVQIGNLDVSDYAMPYVRIVQGTSTMPNARYHVGDFYNDLTGEFATSILVVLLRPARKTRKFMPDKKRGEEKILCASRNYNTPDERYVSTNVRGVTIAGDCNACQFSQWHTDDNGKKIPPPCGLVYEYVAYDIKAGMPFTISFSKSSIPFARRLNSVYAAFGSETAIRMQTHQVQRNGDSYYEPTFIVERDYVIDDALREEIARFQYQLIKAPLSTNEDEF